MGIVSLNRLASSELAEIVGTETFIVLSSRKHVQEEQDKTSSIAASFSGGEYHS